MRILLIGPAESVHVARWAMFLAEQHHDVTIFTEQPPVQPIGNVRVRTAPFRRLPRPVRLLAAAIVLRVLQARFKPDAVHIHSVGSNSLMTALLRRGTLVVSPWGSDVLRPSSWLHRALAIRTLRRAALILTTSRQMQAAIAAILAPAPADVRVISWGVDSEGFGPSSPELRAAARKRWGLPSDATVLLSIRSSIEVFRTDEVVGAFLAAASVRVDLHLVLLAGFTAIGRPSTARTHDYRRRVWARARALAGRITIVDRPLSDVDVASLLASADAAVSIPASDQRSTSVLEALACGLPVLATDIEPYRELRADGYAMDLIGEPIEPSLIAAMVRVVPSTARARARASQPVIAAEDRRVQFASMERAVKGVADRHGPG